MKPKFISGPPGTGKTNFFIRDKYIELINKYGHENIIILSHTNTAADEIKYTFDEGKGSKKESFRV